MLRLHRSYPGLDRVEPGASDFSVVDARRGRGAAHPSERIAAPITTYLAGVAFAGLAPAERLARLRGLLAELEA